MIGFVYFFLLRVCDDDGYRKLNISHKKNEHLVHRIKQRHG